MKLGSWARLVCTAIPVLAGCGSFWQQPASTSSGGCTTNCTTATSGRFYILNTGTTNAILGESIATGKLTAISGSPWNLPAGTPFAMVLAPGGKFLYVSTSGGVFVSPITNGVLGSFTVVTGDTSAFAIQTDTTGTWLIEALQVIGGVTMVAVPLNTSTGVNSGPAPPPPTYTVTNAAVQSGKIAISPDNKYIFVALGAGGAIAVPFNAGVISGSPFGATAFIIPVVNTGGSVLSVAADPGGRLFYVGETLANPAGTSGGLLAYNYSSLGGKLTQAAGSPIASGGIAPNAILTPAAGNYVYVANGQGTTSAGNIASFSITTNSTTYSIATGLSAATGTQPLSLALDSNGTFILGVNLLGSPFFSSYTLDATTAGKLDAQIFANTGASPQAIVAAP